MEAIFDNKANVLNAQLHASHDNSVIYAISTSQTLWRRTYTYLRDTNPASGGDSVIVGAINWRKKTFEIQGQRKFIKDIRRKPKGFFNKWVIHTSVRRVHEINLGQNEILEVVWRQGGVRSRLPQPRRVAGKPANFQISVWHRKLNIYAGIFQWEGWRYRSYFFSPISATTVWKGKACRSESLQSRPSKRRGIPDARIYL